MIDNDLELGGYVLAKEKINMINVYKLIDFYIDNYQNEIRHKTYGYIRAGMLQGLIWICRFAGITDEILGKDGLKRIASERGFDDDEN